MDFNSSNLADIFACFCAEYGITINTDSAFQDESMIKNKQLTMVKELHPFKLTPPPSENGRWQTCYKDAAGVKHNIKAKTEDELLEKLIPIYIKESDKLTFQGLFNEWIEYKESMTSSPNTVLRHRQHFKRYFAELEISRKSVVSISAPYLEMICNSIVKDRNLSHKEWTNVRTVLSGMFKLAVRQGYINTNPLDNVEIHVKYRQVSKKKGNTQTYSADELETLLAYLDEQHKDTGNDVFMAVKINFYLGLRVGELVALKWEDLDGCNLHVRREEIRNQETGAVSVVEHTKTYTERTVMIPPIALKILERVSHCSEYIFASNGVRISSRKVNYVLEKYAERQGVGCKSSHKMRKTYASNLAIKGVPLDLIREQLGHTNLTTTLGYIYNPLSEQETYDRISKAFETE